MHDMGLLDWELDAAFHPYGANIEPNGHAVA